MDGNVPSPDLRDRARQLLAKWRANGSVRPEEPDGPLLDFAVIQVETEDDLLRAFPAIYKDDPELLDIAACVALMQESNRLLQVADIKPMSPEQRALHAERLERQQQQVEEGRRSVWEQITRRYTKPQ